MGIEWSLLKGEWSRVYLCDVTDWEIKTSLYVIQAQCSRHHISSSSIKTIYENAQTAALLHNISQ